MKKQMHKIRPIAGEFFIVPLSGDYFGFGRVLPTSTGFYNFRSTIPTLHTELPNMPLLFNIWIADYILKDGIWKIIGHERLPTQMSVEPRFFKKDPITKKASLYLDSTGEEIACSNDECNNFECAAVWNHELVVERLEDHFNNRPNRTVAYFRNS